MADSSWSDLYEEAKTGSTIPESEGYDVKVVAARALAKSRLLFLDLGVMTGPIAGKVAQVNLYLPESGNRGALFHFRNKVAGFGDLSETFRQMDSAADVEGALNILADALTGRRVFADIELRSDGEYAGTNQLAKTKPFSDAETQTITAADVAAVPAEVVAAVPAATPYEQPGLAGDLAF